MPRFAYVNGRYVPHGQAAVHVEDRGYQFADGVYEVVTIVQGRMVDEEPHLDRLERSLSEIEVALPMARPVLQRVMRELVRRNRVRDGLLYLQITRGVAPRSHEFPGPSVGPALVMTTRNVDLSASPRFSKGAKAITVPDIRWQRCDIKTIALLPNCLAKTAAVRSEAYEALLVDADGNITEGTSSNAWIVTDDGRLITRPPTNAILNGVTRLTILRIAAEEGIEVEERPFSLDEAKSAREVFVSSATSFATPIVRIDATKIGDGAPGPLSRRLLDAYVAYCRGLRAGGPPGKSPRRTA